MARINIPPMHVSRVACRSEIDSLADDNSKEKATDDQMDRHDKKFLKAVFKAFRKQLMGYYYAGDSREERFHRLEEIRQTLTEIGFTDGSDTYTIAPIIDTSGPALRKTCPKGMNCVCGTCQ